MRWLTSMCLVAVAAGSAGCNCGRDSHGDSGVDGGEGDAGLADAGEFDAGTTDAGTTDAGPGDGGTMDAGPGVDGGASDAGVLLVEATARVLKASGNGTSLIATLAGVTGDVTITWSLSPAVGSLSATTGAEVTYTPPARQDWSLQVTVTATVGGLTVDTLLTVLPVGLWADWPVPPDSSSSYSTATGTATDTITGLVWQTGVPTGTFSWPGAYAYCHSLDLGGSTQWRLPGPIELVSLVDFARRSPALGPTFSLGSDWRNWSSLVWDNDGYSAFFVDFTDGTLTSVEISNGSVPMHGVRCVRDAANLLDTSTGNSYPWIGAYGVGAWDFRYAIGPDTVRDTATGLTWQRQPTGPSTLAVATSDCQALALGGFASGWRVPTVKELLTLANLWAWGNDSVAFPSPPAGKYWSSSVVASGGGPVWAVDFQPATSGPYDTATAVSEPHLVRCVR